MFSKNVVFMDGEFTRLRSDGIELLSVALIDYKTNDEFYVEIYPKDHMDEFVWSNVVEKLSRIDMIHKDRATFLIEEFIQKHYPDSKPYLIADVNQFDWMGICQIFGIWGVPFFYIPIDFASILWNREIDPDINREKLAELNGIDISEFKKHNALEDARILRDLYTLADNNLLISGT